MGAKQSSFKRKLLASSISSCILATVSAGVSAQDDKAVDEVVVTGIRASVAAAMDIKREAVGVVDAISAEDIGKMPDANLAESLQRITGLSINRSNGEGSQVTVRGIDARYNMVTLNGRVMPAVTNGDTADNASRAFDFGTLASESVNGTEVYKTGRASNPSGGLGATINIKTLRPLDAGETKASFGAKAVHDDTVSNNTTGDKYTPEVSGLYSWANDDDTFGVAVSGARQVRDSARARSFVNNWQLARAGQEGVAGTPFSGRPVPPAIVSSQLPVGQLYSLPTDIRYEIQENHRVRQNGQVTLQFRPLEKITGTIDYTYSEIDVKSNRGQQSTWYNIPKITAITFDKGPVYAPNIYTETYDVSEGKDMSYEASDFTTGSQNDSVGFNLAYEVTDSLHLELDYHNSQGRSRSDNFATGVSTATVTSEYSDFSKDLPVMGATLNDSFGANTPAFADDNGNNNGRFDAGDMTGSMGSVSWGSQLTEIDQLRLMGAYTLGDLGFLTDAVVDFGLDERTDSNLTRNNGGGSPRITMGNWGGVNPKTYGPLWTSYFTPRNFGDAFPDFNSTTGDAKFFATGIDAYPRGVATAVEWVYAEKKDPANFVDLPNGKFADNGLVELNRLIEEDVTSFYAQFKGAFELGGMPANIVAGARYENTDVTSTSSVKLPTRLEWQDDNDWSVLREGGDSEPYTVTSSYNNFLPNVDFDISPRDDLKVRASVGQTIARANYNQLRSDVAVGNPYQLVASGGNPGITPLKSTNIDLSVEWYYGDDSYLSGGYFIKDVKDFIGDEIQVGPQYGLKDPRNGPRFEAAKAFLVANNMNPADEKLLHNRMLISEGKDPADASTSVYANAADGLAQWSTTVPGNNQDAKIDGIELAAQHWFGESGFGVQANYTIVDSDAEFDILNVGKQYPLFGLSDSYNIVGFYDKNQFQVRIAYNWRDEYLASATQGGGNEPRYVEEFAQIDASVGYEFSENLSFSLEGLNLTGENSRSHGRAQNMLWELEDLGARYSAGVRYTF